jgi:hypothetical protein
VLLLLVKKQTPFLRRQWLSVINHGHQHHHHQQRQTTNETTVDVKRSGDHHHRCCGVCDCEVQEQQHPHQEALAGIQRREDGEDGGEKGEGIDDKGVDQEDG